MVETVLLGTVLQQVRWPFHVSIFLVVCNVVLSSTSDRFAMNMHSIYIFCSIATMSSHAVNCKHAFLISSLL